MFRHILSLMLTASLTAPLAQAQSGPDPSSVPQTPPANTEIVVSVYTSYDVLRRGTEMKVAVVPLRRSHGGTEPLPVFLHSAASLAPESVSTRLQIEPADGFALTTEPLSSRSTRFHFSNQPVEVLTPAFRNHQVAFRVKVTAANSVTLGTHLLLGKLTYREVNDQGISDPQIVPVEIPIRVVPRSVKAKKDKGWTFDNSQKKETTTLVLLSPFLIVLGILDGIRSCVTNACG